MGQEEETIICNKIDALASVVEELRGDVKELREEALPRRVGKLERWRETMSGRWWGFVSSVAVVALGSAISVAYTLITR